jgi:hypothetical protein
VGSVCSDLRGEIMKSFGLESVTDIFGDYEKETEIDILKPFEGYKRS